MNSWYTIRARATGAEVLIYDEIGAYGVSAKGFLAKLGALPEDAPIDLRLNSPGGSVFDAVAIYNALQRHKGNITVWIDGIAASAASYIAMAGDEIVMPENAFLMIHDPSGIVMGTAVDMRDMAGTLDKIAASMTRGYAAKSGKPEAEIATLLAAGLATRLVEPVHIAASFDIGRFRNAPPELAEANDTESATSKADIVEDDNDVAERGDRAPTPVTATNVPGENGDPLAPVDDPATLQWDVTGDSIPFNKSDPTIVAPVNTEADARAIRAETIVHARAVIDLCRLAGQPQMAGRFLEEDVGLDEVRNRLLAAKAEATPDLTSNAHAQPGRAANTNPWGDVIARTFKTKG